MTDLTPFPDYSTNLWDYVKEDMPYMPSPDDRKRVMEEREVHRGRIWDYFFRPKPEDVGKPIRRELSEHRAEKAKTEAGSQQRLQQSRDTRARLEQTWRNELAVVEAELRAIQTEAAARESALATTARRNGSIMAGTSLVAGAFIFVLTMGAFSLNGRAGDNAQNFAGCLLITWVGLGIPALFIGGVMAWSGKRRLTPERMAAFVASKQQQVRANWAQRSLALNSAIEDEQRRADAEENLLAQRVPHLQSRIDDLERLLRNLLDQLPSIPTADEVEKWLKDDLDECVQHGEEQLGVEGRTINVRGTTEPFRIMGPAEIQDPDLIPRLYRRSTEPDRQKYLHARQFGTTADGRAVHHYAVFHLEFLFITGAVLARYSVFFDFIRGERVAERAPQQHFVDVVLLEMRKEYRQIEVDSEKVDLDQAPSMILALSNGDRVTITLTSPEYFAKVGAAAVDMREHEARTVADNAMKAITECVNAAKRNLDVGQLARMKEAERNLEKP